MEDDNAEPQYAGTVYYKRATIVILIPLCADLVLLVNEQFYAVTII